MATYIFLFRFIKSIGAYLYLYYIQDFKFGRLSIFKQLFVGPLNTTHKSSNKIYCRVENNANHVESIPAFVILVWSCEP